MKKFSSDESYVYVNVVLLLIILALVVYCCVKNKERFNGPFMSGTCILPKNQKADGSCLDDRGEDRVWAKLIEMAEGSSEGFKWGKNKKTGETMDYGESIKYFNEKQNKNSTAVANKLKYYKCMTDATKDKGDLKKLSEEEKRVIAVAWDDCGKVYESEGGDPNDDGD
jgi:hypothetical protein